MELSEIVKTFIDNGVTIAVLGYFIYRDNKFLSKLEITLQELIDTINSLKGVD